ncbi:MAG: DUF4397 domain-containing protein [Gemmatimonadetes bacterium]|nr:DUF4397 domain-containing protein [Gemmatimonadota bacterium]
MSRFPFRSFARTAVCVLPMVACMSATDPNRSGTLIPGAGGVQVVNGYGASVDVLVDGTVQANAMANGDVLVMPSLAPGSHIIGIRPTASATLATIGIIVSSTAANSIAAIRPAPGAISAVSLTDTNAVVPTGATKMRVLHLAPLAGEVQVWRTQPDFMTPIRWAFPFTYNTANVYYQSTPGDWEVRIWTDTVTYAKGDASAWPVAWLDRQVVTLGNGQRGTVAIMDKAGGGVKLVRIE